MSMLNYRCFIPVPSHCVQARVYSPQTPQWISISFLMIILILLERSATFILCPVYCRSLGSLSLFFKGQLELVAA